MTYCLNAGNMSTLRTEMQVRDNFRIVSHGTRRLQLVATTLLKTICSVPCICLQNNLHTSDDDDDDDDDDNFDDDNFDDDDH